MQSKEIPHEWFCPITQQVMTDPVIGCDGYTYQRKAIQSWLAKSHQSPVTRQPMQSTALIPNLALRSTIDQMLPEYKKQGAQLSRKQKAKDKSPGELSLEADSMVFGEHLLVNVSVVPPAEKALNQRKKCAIICVLDVSGSMDTEATIKNKNDVEAHGFTRLDLVKHSVNTILHSLDKGDYLALVPFSSKATVSMQLTEMDEKGKKSAEKILKGMKANGSTNIWDGIRVGLDLSKSHVCDNKNVFVLLLTDGQPNMNPPQGIIPTMKKYIDHQGLVSNLHVFGYGYQLDTVLLTQIAKEGVGTYAYIPDCSMVGTIFVNFLANALATVTNMTQLIITPQANTSLIKVYGLEEPKQIVNLGGVQYGQRRDLLCRFTIPKSDGLFLRLTLNYGFGLRKSVNLELTDKAPRNLEYLQSQINRAVHIQGLRTALKHANHLNQGLEIVKNTLKQLQNSPVASSDKLTQMMIKQNQYSQDQNQGQVMKSFQKQQWYDKWGKHYIPSLMRAHFLQVCTNFKDPGLQGYGGNLFKTLQNEVDTLFIKLPPPEPTVKKPEYVAPASMASYYNYGGGCIAGHCQVEMGEGGRTKQVREVRKGDLVRMDKGRVGRVRCVVVTKLRRPVEMVHLPNGLVITPYHPILSNSSWVFPTTLSTPTKTYLTEFFNFVLEDGGCEILINGTPCITLGHNLKDSEVIAHQYLGTEKVIEDLSQMKGWGKGRVEVGGFERDEKTMRIRKVLGVVG